MAYRGLISIHLIPSSVKKHCKVLFLYVHIARIFVTMEVNGINWKSIFTTILMLNSPMEFVLIVMKSKWKNLTCPLKTDPVSVLNFSLKRKSEQTFNGCYQLKVVKDS